MEIEKSVGSGGKNLVCDVFCVQMLLNVWRCCKRQPEIAEDGIAGPETVAAITAFQKSETGWVDGRVDPGGRAWRALEEHARPYVNEALAIVAMGISTTHLSQGYETYFNPPLTEANLLRTYSFRQKRKKKRS
jgi:peptidoglycan hydrolase-like protein with peptidoglycan-binding domain